MFPPTNQMLGFIKMKGYSSSKDVLGTYFDKHDRKLSIMKQATWYTCYNNIKVKDQWQLVNKSRIFDNFQEALHWVFQEAQKPD